jgi:4-hydroxybenzoate polyprenyltransferase
MDYIRLLRPAQWTKNVFIFAGVVFGGKLVDAGSVVAVIQGFFCFCLISSGVYVVNDIRDREEDRLHPRKANRPIASGKVSVGGGALLAALVLCAGFAWALNLDRGFCAVAASYFLLQITYTFALKHLALLDVIALGIGFVLRAIAGAVLVHVEISHWLVVCTFTLCMFLGFSKRRCEMNVMSEVSEAAGNHRRTLGLYTRDLLNHMTTMSAGIAVVTFLLYATDERTLQVFKTDYLVYTLPLVVYAVFRFAFLVEHGRADGPTEVMLRDRPFQAALLIWAVLAMLIVYRGPQIQQALHQWFGIVTTPTAINTQ